MVAGLSARARRSVSKQAGREADQRIAGWLLCYSLSSEERRQDSIRKKVVPAVAPVLLI
jgi:hypothetical protein